MDRVGVGALDALVTKAIRMRLEERFDAIAEEARLAMGHMMIEGKQMRRGFKERLDQTDDGRDAISVCKESNLFDRGVTKPLLGPFDGEISRGATGSNQHAFLIEIEEVI